MKRKVLIAISAIVLLAIGTVAQEDDVTGFETARKERWKKFTKHNFHAIDFSKKRLTKAQLNKLEIDYTVDEAALLRGVVFGKRGRIFKERSIQDYLETQNWYRPNKNFNNSMLSRLERANLDLVRLKEAEKHEYIEPGDMRIWQTKLITSENMRGYSPVELRILMAEIEAIHGKTFPEEEWMQKYFDERYWYKRNAAYSPAVLNPTERKNIETLMAEKSNGRNTEISIGDMDNFQNVYLTEDKLKGLTLMDLRVLRNEIWARRGLKFELPGIRQYFAWRDWYKPLKNQKLVKLNQFEEANVQLFLAQEAKIREKLSTEELPEDFAQSMFTEDLRILRNEMYARHGRVFKDLELQKYFAAQTWYTANPEFKDEMLSEIEFKNLAKIRMAEETAISKFTEEEG